jgi:hypothetical protein
MVTFQGQLAMSEGAMWVSSSPPSGLTRVSKEQVVYQACATIRGIGRSSANEQERLG